MRRSIRVNMILIFSSIVLLSCLIITYMSYTFSVNLVKDSMSQMAGNIALQSSRIINMDQFQQQISIEQGENDYYTELRQALNEIRESTGLTYLYTMGREADANGGGYRYFYLVDGMPFGDEDESLLGDEETEDLESIAQTFESGERQIEMSRTEEYGALVTTYIPLKSSSGEVVSILGADLDATEVYASMDVYEKKVIIVTLLILFISLLIVYVFTHYLIKPLKTLITNVSKVGDGELSIALHTKRKDEIGALTIAFQQMMDNLKSVIQSIHHNSTQLMDTSHQLFASTSEGKASNEQIAVTMAEISDGVDDQARSANDVSQTMERFNVQIQDASDKGSELSQSSNKIIELTNNGYHLMSESEEQMKTIYQGVLESIEKVKKLDTQTKEISELVQVIQGISEQTNILALNAAIEAARAGENGKGFAVVADEVRKLSVQVSGSIESIVNIVRGVENESNETVAALQISYSQVAEGTEKIMNTRETFHEINQFVQGMQTEIQYISEHLHEISKQSEEINISLENVVSISEESSAGVNQISHSAQQSTKVMDEIVTSSDAVAKLAEQLNRSVDQFKL